MRRQSMCRACRACSRRVPRGRCRGAARADRAAPGEPARGAVAAGGARAGRSRHRVRGAAPWIAMRCRSRRAATMTALLLYASFVTLMLGVARTVSATVLAGLPRSSPGSACAGVRRHHPAAALPGKIYGFWTPFMAGSPFGPFVNKNHFAGWMLMALPLTFGLLCANAARVRLRGGGRVARSACSGGRLPRQAAAPAPGAAARHGAVAGAHDVALGHAALARRRSSITGVGVIWRLRSGTRRGSWHWLSVCGSGSFVVGWAGADAMAAQFGSADRRRSTSDRRSGVDTMERHAAEFPADRHRPQHLRRRDAVLPDQRAGVLLREAHNDYLQLAAEGGLLLTAHPSCCARRGCSCGRCGGGSSETSGSSYWIRLGAVTGLTPSRCRRPWSSACRCPATPRSSPCSARSRSIATRDRPGGPERCGPVSATRAVNQRATR